MTVAKIISKLKDLINNNLALLIFSLIYYGIVVFLSGYLNVWEDELCSLNTSSKTLLYALHQSFNFELQPPVYFLLLTLWRSISGSILWARLLSVFFILISEVVLIKYIKKNNESKFATFLTILFLLNPVTFYAILEIRLYALLILLSLILWIQFNNTYYDGKITPGKRILFIVISIFGLYTQYYIGFLLFSFGTILLLQRNFKTLFIYIMDMIVPLSTILLIIPKIYMSANLHFAYVTSDFRGFSDMWIEIRRLIPNRIFEYFIPIDFYGPKNLMDWIFKFVLLVLFLFSINREGLKKRIQQLFPTIISVSVILLFFIFLLGKFGPYWIQFRYTTIWFIPLFFLFTFMLRQLKYKLLIFWYIFFTFIFMYGNVSRYGQFYKVNDIRSLAAYVETHEKVYEPILIYRNIIADHLQYYYNGQNEIIPIPKAYSYVSWNPDAYRVSSLDIDELQNKLTKYTNFYLILDTFPLIGVNDDEKLLLNFFNKNFTLEDKKSFKTHIELYKFSNKEESSH
jgi:hypothetical protein